MSKNTRNRILLTAVAALLLVCVAVGGTMAWLTDSTSQVENTFVPTTLNVDITETDSADEDSDATKNSYTMIPGATIDKDPKVTYSSDVAAYVFVKVTENIGTVTANGKTLTFDDFIGYKVVDGWIALDSTNTARQEGVYYKVVAAGASITNDVIIEDVAGTENKVTVKNSVDKAMMDALKAAGPSAYPTLSFQSWIIQSENLTNAAGTAINTPADAYALVSGN